MKEIIHIGFPKTATTSFQHIFDMHPSVKNIGRPHLPKDEKMENVLKFIMTSSDNYFFKHLHAFKEQLQNYYPHTQTKDVVVLSDEIISMGNFMKRKKKWQLDVISDHQQIAKRLTYLFQNPVVVMVIRNQLDFLQSWYMQNIKIGETKLGFDEYIQQLLKQKDSSRYSLLSMLKYNELIHSYLNILPQNNLKVFVFEEIKKNIVSTIGQMGLDEVNIDSGVNLNQTKSLKEIKAEKKLKKIFIYDLLKNILPLQTKQSIKKKFFPRRLPEYNRQLKEQLENYYIVPNNELQRLLNKDLKPYQYPVDNRFYYGFGFLI